MSHHPTTPLAGDPGSAETPSHEKDRPWVMRTYAGHSTALASNALYRTNLAKGQTGLSVAFDLPTQTGYDPGDPLSRGEVGKVGVPIPHLGEMRRLFADIPLTEMNTSMTINATAMWLLALYQVVAEEQALAGRGESGAPADDERRAVALRLAGTTQNDIVKEYLSRGTYVFPPEHSLRLTTDVIAYTVHEIPSWNPINICSYHLQEAGATPTQELAYALCTAISVLDAVRESGQVSTEDFGQVVGRISFFVNAGVRFVEEMCKMRAFVELWDELTRERYGVTDPAMRRFRYGVQVNSLGLTEAQPENNVQRIVLEMLGVTLSKDARARAVQLPAWNEALGLPRPWDQQWSLRLQQVLAFESDLLEYDDLFTGSQVVERKVAELVAGARAEIDRVQALGGAIAAVESGYMKQALVSSHAARRARIESGDDVVVGVNAFETTEPSPLTADLDAAVQAADPEAEQAAIESVRAWKAARDEPAVVEALARLAADAKTDANLMPATLAAARAGATTGEWAGTLRSVFGEFRAPTGVSGAVGVAEAGEDLAEVRRRVRETGEELSGGPGGRLRLLVGKPGLDGHSNGAEQVAVRARDAGFEVIYQGIRLTPEQIVAAAVAEDVHCVGLSILSGSHMELVPAVLVGLEKAGIGDVPVVVGGIIPDGDARRLIDAGVAAIYTPKDFGLTAIMDGIVDVIREANELA
jgi:ethylmalonyl-CoA mutase